MASEPELASESPYAPIHSRRGQLGQVALLLLLGAVPDQRQRGDAGVRAERPWRSWPAPKVVGDERGGDLVHAHAAVFLGNVDGGKAQLGGLAQQQLAQHARLLGLDGRRVRGRISSRANCAAVAAIWRCSSFRSSG
jgi:hypothetical protein